MTWTDFNGKQHGGDPVNIIAPLRFDPPTFDYLGHATPDQLADRKAAESLPRKVLNAIVTTVAMTFVGLVLMGAGIYIGATDPDTWTQLPFTPGAVRGARRAGRGPVMDRCLNCNHTIRLINYSLGPQWMHVDPNASFPIVAHGTAWKHCRVAVAEPAPEERAEPEEGAR